MRFKVDSLLLNCLEAENDIQYTIERIIDELSTAKESDNVIAYLLGGGFGRGEGSVVKVIDRFVTSNDYDIFAIVLDDCDIDQIKNLESRIENKLGLNYFGIDAIKYTFYTTLATTDRISQSYFDMLFGSKILWTNDNYTEIFNKKEMTKMPRVIYDSAFDVLKTRMWCMIAMQDLSKKKLYDTDYVDSYQKYYFQQVKAATAIVDAILISTGNYKSACFEKKLKAFSVLEFSKENDISLVVKLIEDKIYNMHRLEFNLCDWDMLIKLYWNAIQFVIKNNKTRYYLYSIKMYIKQTRDKIRGLRIKTWSLHDFKYVINNDMDVLATIQKTMRGLYT